MCPVTYHSKRPNTNTTNKPTRYKSPIVRRRSLKNSTNIKDDHDSRQGPLAREPVRRIGHEDAAHKRTEQEHGRHELLAKSRFGKGVCTVELVHHVNNGDDSHIVTHGETAQRREHGGAEDVFRVDETFYARGAVRDGVHEAWVCDDLFIVFSPRAVPFAGQRWFVFIVGHGRI